jgi:hypothetical protein
VVTNTRPSGSSVVDDDFGLVRDEHIVDSGTHLFYYQQTLLLTPVNARAPGSLWNCTRLPKAACNVGRTTFWVAADPTVPYFHSTPSATFHHPASLQHDIAPG